MIIKHLNLANITPFEEEAVLCLGYFDGVHLAHLALINEARKLGKKVAVLTFYTNSESHASRRHTYLNSDDDKIELFEHYGVDHVLFAIFDDEFTKISPNDFIEHILNKLNIHTVVVGYDFRFGHKAKGSALDLKESKTANFKTTIVEKVETNKSEVISTTLIKQKISEGKVREANELLNYNYKIRGKVVKGRGNGAKLGFPTANIAPIGNYVIPKTGVYAGTLIIDNVEYLGMINIGTHPSIEQLSEAIIEIHVFDYNKRIYGKEVSLTFLNFEREEEKFASVDKLIETMKNDEINIRSKYKNLLK
ncbi:MAG: bifunctional riboflavin kinase/FAD synthetase [Erysipelotrichaceae bacterium]|nr:bifunctional riboflavin kinase/FAD synthetase [Erysipelotrichaceae bacterium]